MSGYAYKWVSYRLQGEFDRNAADRAYARGWAACPITELPPLNEVLPEGITQEGLPNWMANFRLYRMKEKQHARYVRKLQAASDTQLQREFEKFQSGLMATAGGKGLAEIYGDIR